MKRSRFLPAALLLLLLASSVAAQPVSEWVVRGTEAYNLEAGESVQFTVEFEDLPVRSWILEVDGDHRLCDLNVLDLGDGTLHYQQHDESRHRVKVPWGRGMALAVTLTSDLKHGGVFTVTFTAPPADKAARAFGPVLNRALEALEKGRRRTAMHLLHDALKDEHDAGVAALLLAGVYREQGEYDRAAGMLDLAVEHQLPEDLRDVRAALEGQLEEVQNRLPGNLVLADRALEKGDAERAETLVAETYLQVERGEETSPWVLSEAWRRSGRAAHDRGELVRAQEMYDRALSGAVTARQRALCLFHSARLQMDTDNDAQARSAFALARDLGLPPDLDVEAASHLARLDDGP